MDAVTELKASQAALRRLQAHFRATIEQLPVGLAHVDIHDRITRVNAAFCTMSGFGVEELTGKFFAEITYPDDLQGSAAALQRLWRGEVPSYAIEKRYVRKDSSILWARVTVAPLHSPEGKLEGAVGILEDITERKAAEAEVGRVHQQLLLASRQAGMADVATNVLHNVGNVLNSLNLSANVLAENLQRSKVDALARCTKLLGDHSAQLASFLLEDERGRHLPEFLTQLSNHMQANQRASLTELTSLARHIDHIKHVVASQQLHAKRCSVAESVAVTTVVEESVAICRGEFDRQGVALIRNYEPVPPITVDKHRVLQILVNLERNAQQACVASGRVEKTITVRVTPDADGVQIQVIDNGTGISPEHIPQLFTHGFTTKNEGHGFGLHDSALAAKALGGTLTVSSKGIGCGATFTLTLPLISL